MVQYLHVRILEFHSGFDWTAPAPPSWCRHWLCRTVAPRCGGWCHPSAAPIPRWPTACKPRRWKEKERNGRCDRRSWTWWFYFRIFQAFKVKTLKDIQKKYKKMTCDLELRLLNHAIYRMPSPARYQANWLDLATGASRRWNQTMENWRFFKGLSSPTGEHRHVCLVSRFSSSDCSRILWSLVFQLLSPQPWAMRVWRPVWGPRWRLHLSTRNLVGLWWTCYWWALPGKRWRRSWEQSRCCKRNRWGLWWPSLGTKAGWRNISFHEATASSRNTS